MKANRWFAAGIISVLFIFFTFTAIAAEYWLVLDSSASLTPRDASLRNESAIGYAEILMSLEPDSRIGVIDFSDATRQLLPTDNLQQIRQFINNIGRSGQLTDIESALNYFLAHPSGVERKVYLFTDGQVDVQPSRCVSCSPTIEDRESVNRIIDQIVPQVSSQKGSTIINAVGLGDSVDSEFLESLSFATGGGTKQIRTMKDLLDALLELLNRDVRNPTLNKKRQHGDRG